MEIIMVVRKDCKMIDIVLAKNKRNYKLRTYCSSLPQIYRLLL